MSEVRYCSVITTVGSLEEAQSMARTLVERKLAACVQISTIESFYVWEGRVQNEPEYRVLLKTRSALYGQVEDAIRELHSYELPAVHALALDRVHDAYGDWIDANTGVGTDGR